MSDMSSSDMDCSIASSVTMSSASQLSSPGRQAAPRVLKFSAEMYPKNWRKSFTLVRQAPHSTLVDGLEFCKSGKTPNYCLLKIDTRAGNKECRDGTKKQWNTIIEKARALDEVPDVIKAIRFQRFDDQLLEKESSHEQQGKLVPLEEYAKSRHEALRKEIRRIAKGGNPISRAQPKKRRRSEEISNGVEIITQLPITGTSNSNNIVTEPSPKPRFSAEKEYYFKLKRIKMGSPISAPSHESSGSIERILVWNGEKQARKVQLLVGHQVSMNMDEIVPDENYPHMVRFSYCDDPDQLIITFQYFELLHVLLDDIFAIDYSPIGQALSFKLLASNERKENEFDILLSPVENETWMILQTCCYKIFSGSQKRGCNLVDEEYFDQRDADFQKEQTKSSLRTSPLREVLGDLTHMMITDSADPPSSSDEDSSETDVDDSPIQVESRPGRNVNKPITNEQRFIISCREKAKPPLVSPFTKNNIPEWVAADQASTEEAAAAKKATEKAIAEARAMADDRAYAELEAAARLKAAARLEALAVEHCEDDEESQTVRLWDGNHSPDSEEEESLDSEDVGESLNATDEEETTSNYSVDGVEETSADEY